ncbi:MAG: RDD family protein [Paludibacteraceae bacterium]|nr:RDD family protein [Paludibacteraceae bacterium]
MVDKLSILSGLYVDLEYVPAPTFKRVLAVSIDGFIYYMALIILASVGFFNFSEERIPIIILVITILGLVPFFCEYFFNGQSIGKMLMKIAVVTDEGTPPSFFQCAIRSLLFTVDFWLVGVILISKKGKRLGDMASGCMVVLKKSSLQERVSLQEEYAYANPDYNVKFEEAQEMNDEDFDVLTKALFDINYRTQSDAVSRRMQKHLGIAKGSMEDRSFLMRLRNDALYYRQVLEQ